MDPPNVTTASVAATTPVVLRIMPLLGSQAPIGYIYDPTPARDGDGGLLAAASAFFSHQGHQVFLDPCPDLAAYRVRAPFSGSPRRIPSSVGYGGHPGGPDVGSVVSSSSSYGRTPHLGRGSIAVGSPRPSSSSSSSPTHSEIFNGGGSNSSDYQPDSSKNSSFWGGQLVCLL